MCSPCRHTGQNAVCVKALGRHFLSISLHISALIRAVITINLREAGCTMNFNSISGIYNKQKNLINRVASVNTSKAKAAPNSSAKAAVNEDKVQISGAAAKQYEVYKMGDIAAKEVSSIDNSAKVAELKSKVEQGTYDVSSAEIAEKMLTNWGL